MKRRCWFCGRRKEYTAKVHWKGRWRKACPLCQGRFMRGLLKERR